jgi:glucokinase
MDKFLGVDLGGTTLRAAVVDTETGELTGQKETQTLAREGHAAVMARMAGLIEAVIVESGYPRAVINGVGIGVPGMLDLEHGTVLFLPNLPGNWLNVPLQKVIEERTGLATHLLNDVRSMTLGEWKHGAGRGVDSIACFAIGTGVGGGLVINGQLNLGIGGSAGELGHQIIDMNGPRCGCGSRGCLEVFASGPAIAAMGVKAVMQGLTTSIGQLVDYDLNRITPKVICQAALEGDAVAREIYAKAGYYLGVAISNVLVVVGSRKVIIGGGVAQAGDLLFEPIRRVVLELVHIMPASQVAIVPAELGTKAGLIGAAIWARERSRR